MADNDDGCDDDFNETFDEDEILEGLMERMEDRINAMVDRAMIEVTNQAMKEDPLVSEIQTILAQPNLAQPNRVRMIYEGAVTMLFLQRLSAFYAANMAKAGECQAHTIAEIVPIVCDGVADGFYANAELNKRERGETRQ